MFRPELAEEVTAIVGPDPTIVNERTESVADVEEVTALFDEFAELVQLEKEKASGIYTSEFAGEFG